MSSSQDQQQQVTHPKSLFGGSVPDWIIWTLIAIAIIAIISVIVCLTVPHIRKSVFPFRDRPYFVPQAKQ